jgi:hypothetical protein
MIQAVIAWIHLAWGLTWMVIAQHANNKKNYPRSTMIGFVRSQSDDEMLSAAMFWVPLVLITIVIIAAIALIGIGRISCG